jgi:uncharacterized damage-inducible protein DinB
MTATEKLVDFMNRAFWKETWSGPSVMEALEGVDAKMAAAHPIANAHSIWELTLHTAVWKDVGRWRIEGLEKQPTDDENFETITDTSEAAWQKSLERLKDSHARLVAAVESLNDEKLEAQIPVGGGLTHFGRLNGIIHHDLYHAGQIVLLKRALGK